MNKAKAQLDERLRQAVSDTKYLESELLVVERLKDAFCDAIRAQRLFNMTPGTKVRLSDFDWTGATFVVESVVGDRAHLEGRVEAHIDDVEVME